MKTFTINRHVLLLKRNIVLKKIIQYQNNLKTTLLMIHILFYLFYALSEFYVNT